ncbi:hypothetical protein BH11ARM1_BH11ARM1_13760 [soil metagenome]
MTVYLADYDPEWPQKFEAERVALFEALSPWLAGDLEHIGSTAIPGMRAKSIIDIMGPVFSLEASIPAIEAASRLQYQFYPYRPELMHWFCKPDPAFRTHHLHLVPIDSPLWRDRLRFRDRLRQSSELANEYLELKEGLVLEFPEDREAYTEGKSEFVARVLAIT